MTKIVFYYDGAYSLQGDIDWVCGKIQRYVDARRAAYGVYGKTLKCTIELGGEIEVTLRGRKEGELEKALGVFIGVAGMPSRFSEESDKFVVEDKKK